MSKKVNVIYIKKAELSVKNHDYNYETNEYNRKMFAKQVLKNEVFESIKRITEELLKSSGNTVVAPVAIYSALIMLAGITAENSKNQIMNVLGLDEMGLSEVSTALRMLVTSKHDSVVSSMSASIWINDLLNFDEEMILKMSKKYQTSSFAGEMGSIEMNQAITDWIVETTGGFLTGEVSAETTVDTLIEILSTVYFCSKWDHEFDFEDTERDVFYAKNAKIECDFMRQWTNTQCHYGNRFSAVSKKLNGGYTGIFVLPDEEVLLDELLHDSQVYELAFNGRLTTSSYYQVDLSMPKYDLTVKTDLRELMLKLGIKDVFDEKVANFSIVDSSYKPVLSKAEQTTRFKVDEEGVEAATCVELGVVVAGIPPKYDEVVFKLNRPFLFMVLSMDAVPVFVGKVEKTTLK